MTGRSVPEGVHEASSALERDLDFAMVRVDKLNLARRIARARLRDIAWHRGIAVAVARDLEREFVSRLDGTRAAAVGLLYTFQRSGGSIAELDRRWDRATRVAQQLCRDLDRALRLAPACDSDLVLEPRSRRRKSVPSPTAPSWPPQPPPRAAEPLPELMAVAPSAFTGFGPGDDPSAADPTESDSAWHSFWDAISAPLDVASERLHRRLRQRTIKQPRDHELVGALLQARIRAGELVGVVVRTTGQANRANPDYMRAVSWLAAWSVRLLPHTDRVRYRDEFESELYELGPQSRGRQLRHALRLLTRSISLRRALLQRQRLGAIANTRDPV